MGLDKDRLWVTIFETDDEAYDIWVNTTDIDPSRILRKGKKDKEGIGYSIQYSWASLVTQLVKNLPAMQETWVLSLGWEDSLEKGTATYSSILVWRIPWTVQSMGWQSQT